MTILSAITLRRCIVQIAALSFSLVVATEDCSAQSWSFLGKDSSSIQWSFDTASLRHAGNIVKVWVKSTYPSEVLLPSKSAYYTSIVGHWAVDCDKELIEIDSSTYTDALGKTVSSDVYPQSNIQWLPAAPGTVAATSLRAICASQTPSANVQVAALAINPTTQLDWHLVGGNGQAKDYTTEYKKFTGKDGNIYYFTKMEFTTPQKWGSLDYDTAFEIVEMDCINRRFTTVVNDVYHDTVFVGTYTIDPDKIVFDPIIPNSLADRERDAVCPGAGSHVSENRAPELGSSYGTAWLEAKGYLVTAYHVVDGAKSLTLTQQGKYIGTAEIIVADPANDVAILKPHLLDGIHPAINFSRPSVELGENILALGYPAPEELGTSIKVTSGTINALSGRDASSQRIDDVRFLQVSAPVQSGNSGGPILDNTGNAVGIIISKLQMTGNNEIAENINYALKISYVKVLLDDLPDLGGVSITENSTSAIDSVNKHQRSVFMITAVR